MHALTATPGRSTTTLSPGQRERVRREGRVARALEEAQRRTDGRFSRTGLESKPSRDGERPGKVRVG